MHAVNIPEHSKGLCWKHLESTAQNPCEPLLKSLLLVGVDHDRFPCEPFALGLARCRERRASRYAVGVGLGDAHAAMI